MYFLSDSLVEHARQKFKNLTITGPQIGDSFFSEFGPGNMPDIIDRPYERFSDYEDLLLILQHDNPDKYKKIHKGIPFYFLSWTAFEMGNYEKALFYMDVAISEDIRKDPAGWMNNPASNFLTLGPPHIQAAARVAPRLRKKVEEQLDRFNNISGRVPISVDDFVVKFVNVILTDPSKRSIITAFYTFLLEYNDRYNELILRGNVGGSIEPLLTHLFKGGLIFESLLKHLYPIKDTKKPTEKLGDIFNTASFKTDFALKSVHPRSSSLQTTINNIKKSDLQTAFNTTSQLRNTTGHNLVWNDVFDIPQKYQILFEQQINAILYIISVKFL